MTKSLRSLCCILGLLMAFHFDEPVQAQVTVWDSEEIARLAEKSARMAEALSRAVELLNNINDLSRTIGRFGALPNLDFTYFEGGGGLKGLGSEVSGLASNIAVLQHVEIASFSDAAAFVNKLTTMPSNGNQATSAGQIRQALDALNRLALEDGYALATHTRENLSVAPQQAASLVAQASAAADLRGDVGANTAAAMAVLDQLVGIKAALASILEVQATQRLALLPVSLSTK